MTKAVTKAGQWDWLKSLLAAAEVERLVGSAAQ